MTLNSLEDIKIKKINEIYHDLEAECYVQRHAEIYIEEQETWEYIGKTFLKTNKPMTILDIGTGSGFVPMLVSQYLKENDRVICTDLSSEMLKITEKKMASFDKIRKEFIKADALEVSNMDLKVDVITMNSVLHHIPDYERVLPQLVKLINKGGFFIIMHERNKLYAANKSTLLAFCHRLIKIKISLRNLLEKPLRMLGLYKKKSEPWDDFNQKVCAAVNGRKIVDQELTIDDINAFVDIHDPDERGEGFDPFKIHQKFFPEFEIAAMDTYKHLGAWTDENKGWIQKMLSRKIKKGHPHEGALFWLVMRKP